jgi:hypothetical protein
MVDNIGVKSWEESDPNYRRNAGALLRKLLEELFELDSYQEVLYLNAIKCNPGPNTIKEAHHLKPCVAKWLQQDFYTVDKLIPKEVPLLVAGNKAFQALKYIYPEEGKLLKSLGLNGCRRRHDLKVRGRPTIFMYNPATYARGEGKIETEMTFKGGIMVCEKSKWWFPPVVGSPLWFAFKDISYLGKVLDRSS